MVCLDGRNLALHRGTGVTTYAHTLLRQMAIIGRSPSLLLDADLDQSAHVGRSQRWIRATWRGDRPAVPLKTAPKGFSRAWVAGDVFRLAQVYFDIHRQLLMVSSRQPPALMHWTYPLPIAFRGVPNVYTIHDLIPLTAPELTDIKSLRFARIIGQVVRAASHIITVSETSRTEIITRLAIPEDKITNTYQPVDIAIDLNERPPPAVTGHFLFCGVIEPRKNLGRLINAYSASGASAPLILAGPDGWRAAEVMAGAGADIRLLPDPIGSAPLTGGVWRAPWLPRAALLDLMRGARALLFPSLAEGFGLPIAEAMALGVPVLTSRGGATQEIAGDAALLVDPLDTRGMAEAIAALARDTALCERLAAAGRKRSAMFSVTACADRLGAVYDRLGVARL